jgi:hypothetical protein
MKESPAPSSAGGRELCLKECGSLVFKEALDGGRKEPLRNGNTGRRTESDWASNL